MFSKELFGQRILEQRKKSGETQKALAKVLGVGATQVLEREHGRATTAAERIALICQHYNISAVYLLGLAAAPVPKYGVKP